MPSPTQYIEKGRSAASGYVSKRGASSPFAELGVSGTSEYGGVITTDERNPRLRGDQRWKTAKDILVNMSMVASGVRYYLNLLARPAWKLDPANDKPEAKAVAEFMEDVIYGTDTSWTRIVRRDGMFKYHGFGISELVAKHRDDGKIGVASVERRPQQTIAKWDLDENGTVVGVWQRPPGGGNDIYLPRSKIVYLVDDALTDSPEGMGWSRHLIEPSNRLKAYLKQEGIGFERDLSGIPVGKAPITAIKKAVTEKKITEAEGAALLNGITSFVQAKAKEPGTGLVVDSQPWVGTGKEGEQNISSLPQWGIELLTGEATSIEALGRAVSRETYDIALIIGVERLLTGREGAGSLSLSQDTSRNLFMNINSTLADMAESYDRDIIKPIGALNGIPDDLMPTLKVEDAAFKDAAQIAQILSDMASAGAVLMPDDPAIPDMRDLIGMPHPLPIDQASMVAMPTRTQADPALPDPAATE